MQRNSVALRAAGLLLFACGNPASPITPNRLDHHIGLADAASCPVAFAFDQTVRVRYRAPESRSPELREERSFRALVEQSAEGLRFVALAPHGAPALIVWLSPSGEVESEVRAPIDLPFPPEYILRDIQRTFYPRTVVDVCGESVQNNVTQSRTGCEQAFSIEYNPPLNLNTAEHPPAQIRFTTASYVLEIELHRSESLGSEAVQTQVAPRQE